jgi:hypothetical protein
MGELGVGREQIELLAALFHADAPNDVALAPLSHGAAGVSRMTTRTLDASDATWFPCGVRYLVAAVRDVLRAA